LTIKALPIQFVPYALLGTALCFALLVWALPIASLPQPSGPYSVGTCTRRFVSAADKDPFSYERMQNRELAVQFWFPCESGKQVYAPYMASLTDVSPFLQSPLFAILAAHLTCIKTHAHVNAPLSTQRSLYPVLVFSHGLMGGRIQNTVQMEELASHGYVIAALDHTFDASFSIFPDGHVVTSQLLAGKASADSAPLTDLDLTQRLKDILLLVNELSLLNSGDPEGLFTHRLDLESIGIFGHSFGGCTAISLCHSPLPFKAGVSYDGGSPDSSALNTPFLVIQAARVDDPLGVKHLHSNISGCTIYDVTLENSGHANFTDLPLLSPLHWVVGLSGTIDQLQAEHVINMYTLSFFDKYLKHAQSEPSSLQLKYAHCTMH
jgi:dienelactone hydrolase